MKDFEDYKNAVLESFNRPMEEDQNDVEITAEIPAPYDGTITIKCHWGDLLDYHNHQNQFGFRATVATRLDSTKDFFKDKLLGTNSW